MVLSQALPALPKALTRLLEWGSFFGGEGNVFVASDLAVVVFVESFEAGFEVGAGMAGEVFFQGEDVVFVGVPTVEGDVAISFFLGGFSLFFLVRGRGGEGRGGVGFRAFCVGDLGVAAEEVVLVDEVEEVVSRSLGEFEGGGVAAEGAGLAEPLFVTLAAVEGVDELGAGDFGAIVLEGEGDCLAVAMMGEDGGGLFLVGKRGGAVGVVVGWGGLHFDEGGGEGIVHLAGFFGHCFDEIIGLFDVDSFAAFVELEEFERWA